MGQCVTEKHQIENIPTHKTIIYLYTIARFQFPVAETFSYNKMYTTLSSGILNGVELSSFFFLLLTTNAFGVPRIRWLFSN